MKDKSDGVGKSSYGMIDTEVLFSLLHLKDCSMAATKTGVPPVPFQRQPGGPCFVFEKAGFCSKEFDLRCILANHLA
ncbi:MAG: hypothetical protein C4576_03280 [Desulfobacteraceae bacterium]|nr:MAG: hypothetical protein C4576_03280 [Desulfobacteraceae bacterium]